MGSDPGSFGHEIVVRPDHGRMLDIDKGRKCYYGYSYGGRLIGLSELRGLEAGIKFFMSAPPAGSNLAGAKPRPSVAPVCRARLEIGGEI